jgi:hypothetical protein
MRCSNCLDRLQRWFVSRCESVMARNGPGGPVLRCPLIGVDRK